MYSPVPTFELIQRSPRRTWVLFMHPDRLILACEEKDLRHEVLRQNSPEQIRLREGRQRPRLTVRTPRPVMFTVTPGQARALRQWLGPLTQRHLKAELKRHVSLAHLPISGLFLYLSSPMKHSSGLSVPSLDPVLFVLGGILILLSFVSEFRPHRILFLLNSIWMSVLGGRLGYQVLAGSRSSLWSILILMQVLVVIHGLAQYRRFAPDKMGTGRNPQDGQSEMPAYAGFE